MGFSHVQSNKTIVTAREVTFKLKTKKKLTKQEEEIGASQA